MRSLVFFTMFAAAAAATQGQPEAGEEKLGKVKDAVLGKKTPHASKKTDFSNRVVLGKNGVRQLGGNKDGRELKSDDDVGGLCTECPIETVFWYQDTSNTDYYWETARDFPERWCTLASIRNEKDRRGAQYAIPAGKVAITQGHIPMDDYLKWCEFENQDSDEGIVTGCDKYGYEEFFKNYEDSSVLDDTDAWTGIDFPLPAGQIHLAIGSNGTLRPVSQLNVDGETLGGYDGGIYECCPTPFEKCMIPDFDLYLDGEDFFFL